MNMVGINCDVCGETALTVPGQDYSNTLDGLLCDCLSCGAPGKVSLIGDDDSGVRFFPDGAPK